MKTYKNKVFLDKSSKGWYYFNLSQGSISKGIMCGGMKCLNLYYGDSWLIERYGNTDVPFKKKCLNLNIKTW